MAPAKRLNDVVGHGLAYKIVISMEIYQPDDHILRDTPSRYQLIVDDKSGRLKDLPLHYFAASRSTIGCCEI